MTELSRVQLGSRLRVLLPFIDVAEDGTETAINLSGLTPVLRVVKPDQTALTLPGLVVTDDEAGEAQWDAAEGVLDQLGVWKLQGEADGYLSKVETFRVVGNA